MNIIIPGLHNSDPEHWQSYFERSSPADFIRIEQKDWDRPDCETWITQIEKALAHFDHSKLILIGHSIGCMAIVHWLKQYGHAIKGTFLVAPSDADKDGFPSYISGFSPIPMNPLSCPSFLVASTDDHVTSLQRSEEIAKAWGSELILLEEAGHIESKSGYGEWKEGLKMIERLRNEVR